MESSVKSVAIVGSGLVGSLLAYLLTSRGKRVTIFEKGPEYPYPHAQQFEDTVAHRWKDPAYDLPPDQKWLTTSGGYRRQDAAALNDERVMVVGGSATRWGAMSDRMHPNDFRLRSRYGVATDWPITYEELEPFYCTAEALLGVSGSDAGDPYAAPRSRDYPCRRSNSLTTSGFLPIVFARRASSCGRLPRHARGRPTTHARLATTLVPARCARSAPGTRPPTIWTALSRPGSVRSRGTPRCAASYPTVKGEFAL